MRSFATYSTGLLVGFAMMGTWVFIGSRSDTDWVPPSPLTTRQKVEAPAYVSIPNMTITLQFVDPKRFTNGTTGQAVYGGSAHGCTILIPSGGVIEAWADHGFAAFAKADDGPRLAHEILHCISGLWHPDWPKILASGGKVYEYYSIDRPRPYLTFSPLPQEPDPRTLQ